MKHHSLALLLAFLGVAMCGHAQTLVADINQSAITHASSDPSQVVGDGPVWFTAWTADHGRELWTSDLTSAGTRLVADLWPGPHSSDPDHLTLLGGVLYFAATGPDGDRELYRSDGTEAGTYRLHDLQPGPTSSDPAHLTVVGIWLYFSADDGVNGRELWRTQGTSGSQGVLDLRPGPSGSAPRGLTQHETWLLFSADDGINGREPWICDGSIAGTHMLADLYPGSSGSNPREFTARVGVATSPQYWRAWFSANAGSGREIFYYDAGLSGSVLPYYGNATIHSGYGGAADPTGFVGDPGSNNGGFACAVNCQNGRELWYESVSGAGHVLCDLNPGAAGSAPSGILIDNLKCHCFATDASGATSFFTTSLSGSGPSCNATLVWTAALGTAPHSLVARGYDTFWVGNDGIAGDEIWRKVFVGPVPHGTRVTDINPGPGGSNITGLRAINGLLVFAADDGVHGRELWVSNGTAAGTFMVRDIALDGSFPDDFTDLDGTLVFTADDGVHGRELWTSNGSPAGTSLLVDIESTPAVGSDPSNLTIVGSRMFCAADDGSTSGRELYATDGTAAGTVLVRDIRPGPWSSDPADLVEFGGKLFFAADDGSSGRELWCSDGSGPGTTLLVDVWPGAGGSDPHDLVVVGGALFFVADDGSSGPELWSCDGTAAGTQRMLDLWPGATGSAPSALTAWNGALWFAADDGTSGVELWTSDGTGAGTLRMADLWPGAGSAAPTDLTPAGSLLFFVADDGIRGRELYRSDATAAGTGIVKDVFAGAIGSEPGNLVAQDDRLVFAADDGIAGRELFTTDGTGLGTVRIHDFAGAASGIGTAKGRVIRAGDGSLILFAADDGVGGNELWSSDGSSAGTSLVAELFAGPEGSNPRRFAAIGDGIWFAAGDTAAGVELFRISLADLGAAWSQPYGVACAGPQGAPVLSAAGAPGLGNGSFGFELDGAVPGQPGIFAIGLAAATTPLLGCTLLVAPAATRFVVCDAAGHAAMPLSIPTQPAHIGLTLRAQAIALIPGTALQIATTRGLASTIGR